MMDGMKPVVYLAGPMGGLQKYGAPIFDAAAADLRQRGYRVINPVDIDLEAGFDPMTDSPEDFDLKAAIRRDVNHLVDCDAIVMLPGHEKSRGATAERYVAIWAGLRVLEYPSMVLLGQSQLPIDSPIGEPSPGQVDQSSQEDILLEAFRITSGDRQCSYGPPDQDFRRTADMWTALFRHLLKNGASFEPSHVAMAMIMLKMSRQIHQKTRDNWTDAAGYARCGWICDRAEAERAAG